MKRIVSIILFCSIFMSMVVPTFAVDTTLTSSTMDEKSLVTVSEISEDVTLVTEDYENGDAVIKLIKKGKVTTNVYVNRQAHTMTITEYEQGREIKPEQIYFPLNTNEVYAATSYTYMGAIEYKCIPIAYVSEVTRLMDLWYIRDYDKYSTYDLYGQYKDLAVLVGLVLQILALPGAIAKDAVSWVLGALGIALDISPLVIPKNTILQASETTYHWRLQDTTNTSQYTMFTGTQYVITEPHAGQTVFKEGYYYPTSYYASRDNEYALKMFGLLYGKVNSVRVSAWKPA